MTIGWIVSLLFTTGSQFLCYIGHEGLDPNPILAAVYAATHRTLFSLGMSWMILACTHGYGGKEFYNSRQKYESFFAVNTIFV